MVEPTKRAAELRLPPFPLTTTVTIVLMIIEMKNQILGFVAQWAWTVESTTQFDRLSLYSTFFSLLKDCIKK